MTSKPLPARAVARHRPGRHLVAAAATRVRHSPTSSGIARRRLVITLTKWLLPAIALMLLASIAVWPEIERATDTARIAIRRMGSEIEGARLTDARYHGVDEQGRPYTLTADMAEQAGTDRINLTIPKGDITLGNGTWLMVQAKHGVFLQHSNQLDLSREVTMYRDDGTTLTTASASIDLDSRSQGRPAVAGGEVWLLGPIRSSRNRGPGRISISKQDRASGGRSDHRRRGTHRSFCCGRAIGAFSRYTNGRPGDL